MATLKDVAVLAGVGMSTASRAISGAGPVSADALARVQAAIKQLNFRPSSIGRSLSAKSLGMIGIFAPSFFGAYYGTILKQTDIELRALRRHVVVATGCGDGTPRDEAIEAVKFLIGRDCDGIVVLGHDLHDDDLVQLHRMHPKMAFLNRRHAELAQASFCPDHYQGGALAARTLLEADHRQLAVVSGPPETSDNQSRMQGFFDELARHGVARPDVPLISSDFSREGGYASTQALLDDGKPFTGLFCANDEMAVGAMSCLHRAGIRVPDDVSVVGYDDDYSAAFTAPGLTSVHIPIQELTQNAVRWLLNQCYGTSYTIERDFPVTITLRASVAKRQGI
ncbi:MULTISPECIES: substrate-binding domain-containing protein [unclassified Janthinobacterium]|uniref:LacI family DNA-binding transcriptional regulator n=1 Tax=unclassified Janthinobacterium TaxID=2610881 RepID=UPI0016079111|nr:MULTISPECIES: substrate-binding domain-containing protein [unclassified Janthinobacterium]MBB5609513.1 LacI family transcriptional regulator [Janthinobacterium sp. S3T4]MBB5614640.1 LacI family transcriptional regulator [Janthinobacterium sp. S3M3]